MDSLNLNIVFFLIISKVHSWQIPGNDFAARKSKSETLGGTKPRGGALGYFLGGYVPPRTPNWHPVLKKIR